MYRFHRSKQRSHTGFTLAETLLTVAILGILMGVVFVNAVQMRLSAKQAALDKNAEVIFEAATSRMVQLRSFDTSTAVKLSSNETNGGYANVNENVAYISKDKGDSVVCEGKFITSQTISTELYNNGWVIEYNPTSLQVAAVYYTEESGNTFYSNKGDWNNSEQNGLSGAAKRIKNGAKVGYHEGNTSDVLENTDKDNLKINASIQNGEELEAVVDLTLKNALTDSDYYIYTKIDGKSSKATVTYRTYVPKEKFFLNKYENSITIDSLKEGKQFKDVFCDTSELNKLKKTEPEKNETDNMPETKQYIEAETAKAFVPGEDLKVTFIIRQKLPV